MKYDMILDPTPGRKAFLLGNEAVVRGALEAGLSLASTYPGTPSSEIGNVLHAVAKKAGVYFEFSTNEKVAMEVAAAGAASGIRSMVFFKHVGLNVAADAFMSTAYVGVRGGLVVITADDPSMHSSQNEQDNRYYAQIAQMPMMEPSSPQEAKDMIKEAFEISEKLGLPVLFRMTTRVNHMRGVVEYGELVKGKPKGRFEKAPSRYVPVPSNARGMHIRLLKKMEEAEEMASTSHLNRVEGEGDVGIITSGAAYNYVADVVEEHGIRARVLKLGFTHPFPRARVREFLKGLKTVVVVEELEPYMEKELRAMAQVEGIDIRIHGKMDGHFPRHYEYTPEVVKRGLNSALGLNLPVGGVKVREITVPSRPPVLCPGCPHRATYYAIGAVLRAKKIRDETIFTTDIGCYTLGIQKPYEMADYLLCMGSSAGAACGFAKATDQPVMGFAGDSTFFHACIPALINAVHNRANMIFVVLDNRTTAMTGHQPHPGLPIDGLGDETPALDIEKVVRGIGIEHVEVVDPYDIKETKAAFRRAVEHDGISVVITRRECALIMDARNRKAGIFRKYDVNQDKCTRCYNCVENFACPAFYRDEEGGVHINPYLCDGCGVCSQRDVCPFGAIEEVKKE